MEDFDFFFFFFRIVAGMVIGPGSFLILIEGFIFQFIFPQYLLGEINL